MNLGRHRPVTCESHVLASVAERCDERNGSGGKEVGLANRFSPVGMQLVYRVWTRLCEVPLKKIMDNNMVNLG